MCEKQSVSHKFPEWWPGAFFFFLPNASPDSPSSFLPPLIHFSFLEPISTPQTVQFTGQDILVCLTLASLCGPCRLYQFPPYGWCPSRWPSWPSGPGPRLPVQPSRAGPWPWVCRCSTRTPLPCLTPSVGNLSLFWSQGFSKTSIPGVPPRGAVAVRLQFSDTSFPSGLGPDPSAESSCHERNDRVLCTFESLTPSSSPPLGWVTLFVGLVWSSSKLAAMGFHFYKLQQQ